MIMANVNVIIIKTDHDEICTLLGYYAASNGNPLPTFRDNVSVPSSSVKKSKISSPLKMGKKKVKVKVTLEQATKAHRGSRGIALLFL